MARTKTETAGEALARLRGLAAAERAKAREVEATLEATHAEAERLEADIVEAYEREDEPAAQAAREALANVIERAADMRHRVDGAQARVRTAQHMVDVFAHDNSQALLTERVKSANEIATNLQAAVIEVIGLHKALIAERAEMDRVISAGGGSPRLDGAESTHPWERALGELARAVQQHPALDAPSPRWHGRQHAEERDRVHAQLQAQRG